MIDSAIFTARDVHVSALHPN